MVTTTNYSQFLGAGLSIIPIKMPEKAPTCTWKLYQSRLPAIGELKYNGSIGLVCGPVSGNVEVIDIDAKNDKGIFTRLQQAIEEHCPDILEKMTTQTTINGGLHLIYKCSIVEGNQKLAQNSKREVLIETRGVGGYIVIAPTVGYTLTQGEYESIQEITPEEREELLAACRSLNEYYEPVRHPIASQKLYSGLTPWDDYNSRGDVLDLLTQHGWRELKRQGDNMLLRRPGKDFGQSASWNGKTFYCFTSSTAFEPSKAYSPVAVYAILEHGGDYAKANSALYSAGYGDRHKGSQPQPVASFFRLSKIVQMEKPKKLFGPLWAEGEIAFLFAEDGAGKSILAVQIGCSIATGQNIPGFENEVKPQPVALFDAELSDFQFSNRYREGVPSNFMRLTFNEDARAALVKADVSAVVAQIESTAVSLNSRVIILDNLAALTSMIDATKTSDAIQLMGLLNDLKKKGFSILIVDHCRKPMKENEFKSISKHDMQGSKMKSNLVDSMFSIGKSAQGENYRYIKGLKVRSYDMAFTKSGVGTMLLRPDPLRLDFVGLEPEWTHVTDRSGQINKMNSEGKSQAEIAREVGITQAAVSKNLSKDRF